MTQKLRNITYTSEADCIADIETLRRGHRAGGNWTLAQACYHMNYPLEQLPQQPTSAQPTPDQQKLQGFLERVIANGWPTDPGNSPKPMIPPENAGPEAIDALINSLRQFAKRPSGRYDALVFGPVEIDKLRKFFLVHAEHHLNYFEPTK
jgi:hypothetical protein